MTIASAFNDIAVAQGGTAAKSGAITASIDALNDALAGSDQPQAKTIEQAVRLLGEHIGGGGGGEVETATLTVISNSDFATLSAPVARNVGAGTAYIASSPIDSGTNTYTVLIGGVGSQVTIESSNSLQISVSGNIENAGATNAFIVTGDASITLTA